MKQRRSNHRPLTHNVSDLTYSMPRNQEEEAHELSVSRGDTDRRHKKRRP